MSTLPYVVWNDGYSVGVEILDDQHKQLINIINELYSAMHNNERQSVVGHTLVLLKKYSIEHFTKEEEIMYVSGYSGLDFHKKSHDFFRQHTVQLIVMNRNIEDLSIDVLDFLKDWLIKHIRCMDRMYIPCVTGKRNS